jgi:hypothetical protein
MMLGCFKSTGTKWSMINDNKRVSFGYWRNTENVRNFFDDLADILNIGYVNDWYDVPTSKVTKFGGASALAMHGNSFSRILHFVYPDTAWQSWKFQSVPKERWNNFTMELYFDWMCQQLNINDITDWYTVQTKDFKMEPYGNYVLSSYYQGKLWNALIDIYGSNFDWHLWKFTERDNDIWKDQETRKKFFDWVMISYNMYSMDAWYNFSPHAIQELGGKSLLEIFDGSLFLALKSTYEFHDWHPWRFQEPLIEFWEKRENVERYLEWLSWQLCIEIPHQWYDVAKDHIIRLGGTWLITNGKKSKEYPIHW